MKSTTMKMMLAAAVLTVASGVASAQTAEVKIPFAFHANGEALPAGTYRLHASDSGMLFQLADVNSGKRVILLSVSERVPQADWKSSPYGLMSFRCGPAGCSLAEFWMGYGNPTHRIRIPKTEERMNTRVALIRMAGASR